MGPNFSGILYAKLQIPGQTHLGEKYKQETFLEGMCMCSSQREWAILLHIVSCIFFSIRDKKGVRFSIRFSMYIFLIISLGVLVWFAVY